MSENEIIEIVKNEITNTYAEGKAIAFQGLLDLYQKEKEKNKKLEIELEIKKYCKVNELANDLIYYKNLAKEYQGNCISKDKIKAIRQKLNRIVNMEFERHRASTIFVNICGVEADIDELLERK